MAANIVYAVAASRLSDRALKIGVGLGAAAVLVAFLLAEKGSIGQQIPHAQVFAIRADGCVAGPGEEGELVHAGPLVSLGYWEQPKMTAARIRPCPALRDVIGASQPVTDREHFAGRHDMLRQLISAVEQQRLHVVIYGERGIGKTSLLHVFAETAREARYTVLYGSCGSDTDFEGLFRAFAARIPRIYHRAVAPNSPEAELRDNFDVMLSNGFGPRGLADLLSEVTGTRIILILDEYDRVVDPSFRRDIAELIKNLSDRAARVQLVLAGVAMNLDEILGFAPSVRRNIVGLPLRPMTPSATSCAASMW
jgi:hypothetical protein